MPTEKFKKGLRVTTYLFVGIIKGSIFHFRDIGTRGKGLSGSGQNEAADGVVLIERGGRVNQIDKQGITKGIQGLGTVQCNEPNTLVPMAGIDLHVFIGFLQSGSGRNPSTSRRKRSRR
jgi:hypothetical protein